MSFNLPPESDACVDIIDSRDYTYSEFEEIAGNENAPASLPRSVLNLRTSIQNQGITRNPSSKYACTIYAG